MVTTLGQPRANLTLKVVHFQLRNDMMGQFLSFTREYKHLAYNPPSDYQRRATDMTRPTGIGAAQNRPHKKPKHYPRA